MNTPNYVIIMAGGSGERFWPMSTSKRPKQFLPFGNNGESLIRMTCDRIAKIVGKENILIATLEQFEEGIQQEVPYLHPSQIISEPLKRDTTGCIIWALSYLESIHSESKFTTAIISADSFIGDDKAYAEDLLSSIKFARENDAIVTLGMKPSRPETGYGYIHRGEKPSDLKGKIWPVHHYVEKPSKDIALEMMLDGKYFWNCGSYIWSNVTFWKTLEKFAPQIHSTALKIRESSKTDHRETAVSLFSELPNISIDYTIAEKADNIYVCPGNFVWDDIGSWDALPGVLKTDENNSFVLGKVQCWDSKECVFINESDHELYTLGLDKMVVIQTHNKTFICPRSESQNVKKVVKLINKTIQKEIKEPL